VAKDLTIISYNIHHGEGRDGVVNLTRVADVLQSASPDLVALQEVDRNKKRTGYIDQVDELSQMTGMHAAYSVSIDSGIGGQYGNMVLSRLPILESAVYPLPGEPRSLLETRIKLTDTQNDDVCVMFYSTHLDLQKKPRLQSVNIIRKVITSAPVRRVILAGDLNAIPGSPTMLKFSEFMHKATADRRLITISDANGENGQQIDYILFRPNKIWQVVDMAVIQEPVASDHYPIMATLRLI
jgi:endonuclease/exonuclease/phosphatase family metal-dependent hydrolase